MSLPLPANVTCDIYREGNSPPAAADIAGVPGHLRSVFRQGLEAGQGLADPLQRFSHILLIAPDVDVRDIYDAGVLVAGHDPDIIFIPDAAGTSFRVVFVERRLQGSPFDHQRVYLSRQTVAWPSDEL